MAGLELVIVPSRLSFTAAASVEATTGQRGDGFTEGELEELLEGGSRWTIFEDADDELRHLRRRGDVLAQGLANARLEIERLHEAGMGLQEAHESLQLQVRERAGDTAYWKALAEARGEELQRLVAAIQARQPVTFPTAVPIEVPGSPKATFRPLASPSSRSPLGSSNEVSALQAGAAALRRTPFKQLDQLRPGNDKADQQVSLADKMAVTVQQDPRMALKLAAVEAAAAATAAHSRAKTAAAAAAAAVAASPQALIRSEEKCDPFQSPLSISDCDLHEELQAVDFEEPVPVSVSGQELQAEDFEEPVIDAREELRQAAAEAARAEPGKWRQMAIDLEQGKADATPSAGTGSAAEARSIGPCRRGHGASPKPKPRSLGPPMRLSSAFQREAMGARTPPRHAVFSTHTPSPSRHEFSIGQLSVTSGYLQIGSPRAELGGAAASAVDRFSPSFRPALQWGFGSAPRRCIGLGTPSRRLV